MAGRGFDRTGNQRSGARPVDGERRQLGKDLRAHLNLAGSRDGQVARDKLDVDLFVVEQEEALNRPGCLATHTEWDDPKAYEAVAPAPRGPAVQRSAS